MGKPNKLSEWIARIQRGDKIEDVRHWFILEICEMGKDVELTPLEQVFFDSIRFHFERWEAAGRPKRPKH
jgi:hypothetical protein